MNEPTTQHKPVGPGVFAAVAVGMVIIVIALLWLLFSGRERADQTATTPAASTTLAPVPAPVTEFLTYLQDNRAEEAMAKDHAYTSDGLRRLAAALASLSEHAGVRSAEVTQQLAQLRQQADDIQADPHATSHAASIRTAFTRAADLMATLQQQRYPNLDAQVAQVRRAAEAIDPAQLTLTQKQQVGAFFAQAGEALRMMTQTRS